MALELKQQVKLSQQLVMTPQLQQAIKLLQLSRMELVGLVQHELEENPVLEEVLEGEEERSEETGETASDVAADASAESIEAGPDAGLDADIDGAAESELRAGEEGAESVEAGAEPEPTDAEKIADVDWQSYAESQPQTGMREVVDDEDRPSLDATLTRRENLSDHLLWQLQLASFPV
jgi:RNA polymerase sigma-54 factor